LQLEEFRKQRAAATHSITAPSLPADDPEDTASTAQKTVFEPTIIHPVESIKIDGADKVSKVSEGAPVQSESAPEPDSTSMRINDTPETAQSLSMLQQHIDELTQEKFTMQRNLEQQQMLLQRLANENEELTQRLNGFTAAMEAMEMEVEARRREVATARMHVQSAMAERDAYELSAREASEQASSLASEVVALEEKVLAMKSSELRVLDEREGLLNGLLRENEALKQQIELASKSREEEESKLTSTRLVNQLQNSNLLANTDEPSEIDCLPPSIKALLPVPGFDLDLDFDLAPSVHHLVARIYKHLESLEGG
jgi:predicted  nucleic acid-binding Zn-ribbon protein